jgi:hypothetical protein
MKDHYVEKSGYWIYDSITKTLTHSDMYPYFNGVSDWIYVDGPGVIQVKNDVIFKFIPQTDSFDDLDKIELKCWVHKPKEYIGFTEKYFYCTVCGTKL